MKFKGVSMFRKALFVLVLVSCIVAAKAQADENPIEKFELGISINLQVRDFKKDIPVFVKHGIRTFELIYCKDILEDQTRFSELKKVIKDNSAKINSIHYPYGGTTDISCMHPDVRKATIEDIEFYLGKLSELNGRYLVLHPSWEPIENSQRDLRIKKCRESLVLLSDILSKYKGIKIAMENLPNSCLGNTSKEMLVLFEGVDPNKFGMCLDTNHMLTENLIDFTKVCSKWIVTVHISDYDGAFESHWLPGQGINRWEQWNEFMRASDYKGAYVYEVTWPTCNNEPITTSIS
jgi:sugar phosphate isomerase/epimerase